MGQRIKCPSCDGIGSRKLSPSDEPIGQLIVQRCARCGGLGSLKLAKNNFIDNLDKPKKQSDDYDPLMIILVLITLLLLLWRQ